MPIVLDGTSGVTSSNATLSGSLVLANTVISAVTGTGSMVLSTNPTISGNLTTGNVVTVGTSAYFTSNGNIGVGNSTPAFKLSVNGFLNSLGFIDTVTSLGSSGTAKNIDVTNGGVFTSTLTGDCTFTLQNSSASGATAFILILTNDATPSRTVAFSGGTFKYPGGSVTRSTAANAIDLWYFMTTDGGTNWYVSIPMANVA